MVAFTSGAAVHRTTHTAVLQLLYWTYIYHAGETHDLVIVFIVVYVNYWYISRSYCSV